MCKDCVQMLTDFQEAVRSNTSFVSSLIDHVLEECEHLLPEFVDTVIEKLIMFTLSHENVVK